MNLIQVLGQSGKMTYINAEAISFIASDRVYLNGGVTIPIEGDQAERLVDLLSTGENAVANVHVLDGFPAERPHQRLTLEKEVANVVTAPYDPAGGTDYVKLFIQGLGYSAEEVDEMIAGAEMCGGEVRVTVKTPEQVEKLGNALFNSPRTYTQSFLIVDEPTKAEIDQVNQVTRNWADRVVHVVTSHPPAGVFFKKDAHPPTGEDEEEVDEAELEAADEAGEAYTRMMNTAYAQVWRVQMRDLNVDFYMAGGRFKGPRPVEEQARLDQAGPLNGFLCLAEGCHARLCDRGPGPDGRLYEQCEHGHSLCVRVADSEVPRLDIEGMREGKAPTFTMTVETTEGVVDMTEQVAAEQETPMEKSWCNRCMDAVKPVKGPESQGSPDMCPQCRAIL